MKLLRMRSWNGSAGLPRQIPFREFPQGYDTYIEQGRNQCIGRPEAAPLHCQGAAEKPKVLILDDSTSAVDTKPTPLIRQAFREEIPDTTKLIIAQRVASVQDADQIVVLDGGRIATWEPTRN